MPDPVVSALMKTPELRAAPPPSLKERIVQALIGQQRPSPEWQRLANGVPNALSLFPPLGAILSGNQAIHESHRGNLGGAALSALGVTGYRVPGPEMPVLAAIKADNGRIFTGDFHGEAAARGQDAMGDKLWDGNVQEGFMTNWHRFVSRQESGDLFHKATGGDPSIGTEAAALDWWNRGYRDQSGSLTP